MEGRHTEFRKKNRRLKNRIEKESGRSNQNHAAEREIGELKKRWRRRMFKKQVPRRFWDYGLIYEARIIFLLPRGQNGRSGEEEVTGQTLDVSEYLDFENTSGVVSEQG